MSRTIRSLVAAFLSSALLLSQAAPALASTTTDELGIERAAHSVPVRLRRAVPAPDRHGGDGAGHGELLPGRSHHGDHAADGHGRAVPRAGDGARRATPGSTRSARTDRHSRSTRRKAWTRSAALASIHTTWRSASASASPGTARGRDPLAQRERDRADERRPEARRSAPARPPSCAPSSAGHVHRRDRRHAHQHQQQRRDPRQIQRAAIASAPTVDAPAAQAANAASSGRHASPWRACSSTPAREQAARRPRRARSRALRRAAPARRSRGPRGARARASPSRRWSGSAR